MLDHAAESQFRFWRSTGGAAGPDMPVICTKMNAPAAGGMRREYTSAMRLRPLLLHALLSLALVANGIGDAIASVHSACAHDAAAVAEPASEPPCHQDINAATSNASSSMPDDGMLHDGMHQSNTSQHAPASDGEGCGDCANDCRCACIAHGLAALMPSTVLLPVRIGIAYTPARPDTHTAPALPHLVRPPIG